jgi:hypothetical protein
MPTRNNQIPSLPHCPGDIQPLPVSSMVAQIPILAGLKKCLFCDFRKNLEAMVIKAAHHNDQQIVAAEKKGIS